MIMESEKNWLLIVITVLLLLAAVIFWFAARAEAESAMIEAQTHEHDAGLHQIIEQQQGEIETLRRELEKRREGGLGRR